MGEHRQVILGLTPFPLTFGLGWARLEEQPILDHLAFLIPVFSPTATRPLQGPLTFVITEPLNY